MVLDKLQQGDDTPESLLNDMSRSLKNQLESKKIDRKEYDSAIQKLEEIILDDDKNNEKLDEFKRILSSLEEIETDGVDKQELLDFMESLKSQSIETPDDHKVKKFERHKDQSVEQRATEVTKGKDAANKKIINMIPDLQLRLESRPYGLGKPLKTVVGFLAKKAGITL